LCRPFGPSDASLLSTHLGAGRRLLGSGLQQAGQRVGLPRQLLQAPRLLLAQRLGAVAVLRAHQIRTVELDCVVCSVRKRQGTNTCPVQTSCHARMLWL